MYNMTRFSGFTQNGNQIYDSAHPNIKFIPGMPKSLNDYIDGVNGIKSIVFDDLMTKCADSNLVAVFMQKRHHHNLTVVLILHILFVQGKIMRNINLNTQYIVLLNNPRNKGQFNILRCQLNHLMLVNY